MTQLPSQLRENSSFTIAKVKLALECPRLFYLNHHFSGETLFLAPDRILGAGKTFKMLAEEFMNFAKHESSFKDLVVEEAEKIDGDRLSNSMQQLFYEIACDYLNECNYSEQIILKIWETLKILIQKWAVLIIENRRYCTSAEVFSQTFVSQKFKLKQQFDLGDNNLQPIVGKLATLIYNFERKRLCVIEYKTYQSQDMLPQIAEVGLYSYLLQKYLNCPVDAVIYDIFPSSNSLEETFLSSEELESKLDKFLLSHLKQMQEWAEWESKKLNPPPPTNQPHLCEICPQQVKCKEFFEGVNNNE